MAINNSPEVLEAKRLALKFNKTKVIIIMLDDHTGKLEYASYGLSSKLCADAKRIADVAFDAIYKFLS